jgi:phage gp36-like protein
MPYATLDDLTRRFSQEAIVELTDLDGDGVPDAAILDPVIADVDAEINAALMGRYPTPMIPADPLLVRIAADLVRHALYVNGAPPVVKERAETSRERLLQIARGTLRLNVATSIDPSSTPPVAQARIELGRRKRMRHEGDRE